MMNKSTFLSTAIMIFACAFSCQGSNGLEVITKTTSTVIVPKDSIKIANKNGDGDQKRSVFKLNAKTDIPITVLSAGWSVYCMTKVYNKGASDSGQILSLNKNNINAFDRWDVRPYNGNLDKTSYIPFYAAIPLPLVFFLAGDEMRSDFLELTFLYFETLSVTGLFGYSATHFVDRYRPYAYDASTSMGERMGENAKNSFYAGHVEVIATSTFFISEVYASYYPDSKIKWLFFGLSGAATAGMGYFRLNAGEHFPSDIVLGAAAGTLSGILVPYFHKHKIFNSNKVSLSPFSSGSANGLSMVYKLNK